MNEDTELKTLVALALKGKDEFRPKYYMDLPKDNIKPVEEQPGKSTRTAGAQDKEEDEDLPKFNTSVAEGGSLIGRGRINNVSLDLEGGDSQDQDQSEQYSGEDSFDDYSSEDESSEEEQSEGLEWDGADEKQAEKAESDEDDAEDEAQKNKNEELQAQQDLMSKEITFTLKVDESNDQAVEEWQRWKGKNISSYEIEIAELDTERKLELVKSSLQLRFPYLMANVIKILLLIEEE